MPDTKFFYMDEKYAEQSGPPRTRITSLTGVLIPAAIQPTFRNRYYQLVTNTIADPPNTISEMPLVHAASMFPQFGADDSKRFEFVRGLVEIVTDLSLKIYRVGYFRTPEMVRVFGDDEKNTLGLCVLGLLGVLSGELQTSQIWPVMEIDQTAAQDAAFAGFIQRVDYLTTRLPPGTVSINNETLGELHYVTKKSAHGTVADFAAYLRHVRYLAHEGITLTPFKQRLAAIAEPLDSVTAYDEVIEMNFTEVKKS